MGSRQPLEVPELLAGTGCGEGEGKLALNVAQGGLSFISSGLAIAAALLDKRRTTKRGY